MKTCTKCNTSLPLSGFYKNGRHGIQSWCRVCVLKRARERHRGVADVAERACRRCKRTLVRSNFTGKTNICDDCKDDGHKNIYHSLSPEERTARNRADMLKKAYKLTPEEFDQLAVNGCAVCGTFENLCVDHDHNCCSGKYTCGKCVRGVLCGKHNKGEGAFETIDEIVSLLAYRLKFEKIGEVIID